MFIFQKIKVYVIFQNQEDRALFYELKIITKNNLSAIVNGSGVNMNLYPFSSLPKKPVFLMISRLIKDKGVREYVQAAKIVRSLFLHDSLQNSHEIPVLPFGEC